MIFQSLMGLRKNQGVIYKLSYENININKKEFSQLNKEI
jgi:hypothetical protein